MITEAKVLHPGPKNDGVVHIDRLEVWQGTRRRPVDLSNVEAWLRDNRPTLQERRSRFRPPPAAHLIQRPQRTGVTATEHTSPGRFQPPAGNALDQVLRTATLALYDHPALLEELASVRLVEAGTNRFKIDHDAGKHDDMTIALS